jgi:citrate synthase
VSSLNFRNSSYIYRNVYFDGVVVRIIRWLPETLPVARVRRSALDELMRLYCAFIPSRGWECVGTRRIGRIACRSLFELFRWSQHSLDRLHGLANQEVQVDLNQSQVQRRQGSQCRNHYLVCPGHAQCKKVIPGYGHAVLRKTDPRYMCQRIRPQTHARRRTLPGR